MKRNEALFIMGSLALTNTEDNVFKGATVVKVVVVDASLNSYHLVL